jgi:hypothetical protein
MHKSLRILAGLTIAVAAASPLAAQVRKNAFTPLIGYILPMSEVIDGDFLKGEQTGGVMVGITAEFGLSKNFSLSAYAGSTIGLTQSFELTDKQDVFGGGAGEVYTFGAATTQLGATLVFRPMGVLPNGGPKAFYLEAGAAMNLLAVSDVQARGSGDQLAFGGSYPMAIFGAGYGIPMGPRTTAVIFARYNLALSEYDSDWLQDWNSQPPENSDPGLKSSSLLFGVGIRTGF